MLDNNRASSTPQSSNALDKLQNSKTYYNHRYQNNQKTKKSSQQKPPTIYQPLFVLESLKSQRAHNQHLAKPPTATLNSSSTKDSVTPKPPPVIIPEIKPASFSETKTQSFSARKLPKTPIICSTPPVQPVQPMIPISPDLHSELEPSELPEPPTLPEIIQPIDPLQILTTIEPNLPEPSPTPSVFQSPNLPVNSEKLELLDQPKVLEKPEPLSPLISPAIAYKYYHKHNNKTHYRLHHRSPSFTDDYSNTTTTKPASSSFLPISVPQTPFPTAYYLTLWSGVPPWLSGMYIYHYTSWANASLILQNQVIKPSVARISMFGTGVFLTLMSPAMSDADLIENNFAGNKKYLERIECAFAIRMSQLDAWPVGWLERGKPMRDVWRQASFINLCAADYFLVERKLAKDAKSSVLRCYRCFTLYS